MLKHALNRRGRLVVTLTGPTVLSPILDEFTHGQAGIGVHIEPPIDRVQPLHVLRGVVSPISDDITHEEAMLLLNVWIVVLAIRATACVVQMSFSDKGLQVAIDEFGTVVGVNRPDRERPLVDGGL